MVPETGRVYHPGAETKKKFSVFFCVCLLSSVPIVLLSGPPLCGGVGLISDKLSILWTQEQRFVFGDGDTAAPTSFVWDECEHQLDNSLLEVILKDKERGIGFMGEAED